MPVIISGLDQEMGKSKDVPDGSTSWTEGRRQRSKGDAGSMEAVRTRALIGDAGAYRAEVVRVLALDAWPWVSGIGREQLVCEQYQRLWEPGGAVFIAERAGRVEGVIQLAPDLMASAFLDCYAWRTGCMAAVSDVRARIIQSLMTAALGKLEPAAQHVSIMIPASDSEAVRGLTRSGFEVTCGSVLLAIDPERVTWHHPPSLSVAPLRGDRVAALKEMVDDERSYDPFAWDPAFDGARVSQLRERRLLLGLREPDVLALGAHDGKGQLVGAVVASVGRPRDPASTLAGSVDFVGMRPDRRGQGIQEALHRCALHALCSRGVRKVTTQPMLRDEASLRHLRILEKVGYRPITTSLVMRHREASSSRGVRRVEPESRRWKERVSHGESRSVSLA